MAAGKVLLAGIAVAGCLWTCTAEGQAKKADAVDAKPPTTQAKPITSLPKEASVLHPAAHADASTAKKPQNARPSAQQTAPPPTPPQIFPASLSFPDTEIHKASPTKPLTVQNGIAKNSFTFESTDPSFRVTDPHNCLNDLPANQECQIDIVFQPEDEREYEDKVTVTSSTGAFVSSAQVTGVGKTPPAAPAQNGITTNAGNPVTTDNDIHGILSRNGPAIAVISGVVSLLALVFVWHSSRSIKNELANRTQELRGLKFQLEQASTGQQPVSGFDKALIYTEQPTAGRHKKNQQVPPVEDGQLLRPLKPNALQTPYPNNIDSTPQPAKAITTKEETRRTHSQSTLDEDGPVALNLDSHADTLPPYRKSLIEDYQAAREMGDSGPAWFRERYATKSISCINRDELALNPNARLRFQEESRAFFLLVNDGGVSHVVLAFDKDFAAASTTVQGVFNYPDGDAGPLRMTRAAKVTPTGDGYELVERGQINRG